MRLKYLVLSVLAMGVLSACESKEDVAVAKAEKCLNTATSGTAMECVSSLSSYTSEKSYLLRCSALYLKNGFTGTRLLEAFKALKNTSGGTDPMVTIMSVLAFSSISESETAASYCSLSGSISMKRLADMTKIATFVPVTVGITPNNGLTEAQMITAINNFKAQIGSMTPDQQASFASTITSTASSYCYSGSTYETNVVCTNLNAAVQSGDNAAIINGLMDQLLAN